MAVPLFFSELVLDLWLRTEKLMGAALNRIGIAYVSLALPADHKHTTNESSSVACVQLECAHCFSFVPYGPLAF